MANWKDYKHLQDETSVKEIPSGTVANPLPQKAYDWNFRSLGSTSNYESSSGIHLNQLSRNPMANAPAWASTSTLGMTSTSTDPPYSKSNGYSGFSSIEDQGGGFEGKKKQYDEHPEKAGKSARRRCFSISKMVVVFICIAFGIAGVVYLIINFHQDPSNDGQTDRIVDKKEYTCNLESDTARFKEPLEFICTFKSDIDLQKHTYSVGINFTSVYAYLGDNNTNIEVDINKTFTSIGMWNISVETNKVKLKRTPVKCDSSGTYSIYFTINGKTHAVATFSVEVESETSQVSLEVGRQSNTSDLYDIACSAKSECSPVPILLLGKIGGKTVPLFGSDFQCIITFSSVEGWSANCTGTMPQSIIESFSDILCTTRTGNDTVDETKEAKINKKQFLCKSDDCVFNCPEEDGDKFYLDPTDCTVFHRCVDRRLYTRPCGKGTYFNTKTCACDHKDTVEGCNNDGLRPPEQYEIKERCDS